jgi:biopolymer transport protein ExbD
MPSVIIVSLIDILAILLIFVIVTTTFRRDQPQIVIKLPESTTASAAPNPSLPAVLSISPDEKIVLDEKPVTLETLSAALAELQKTNPNRPLALNADTKAPFGVIIRVIEILKEAGVKNLPAFMESKAP